MRATTPPLSPKRRDRNVAHAKALDKTQPGASLAHGWYKHKFAPGHKLIARLGPYASQEETEAAE